MTPANSWSNFAFIIGGNISIFHALVEYMRLDETREAPMSNQLAKQPLWLVMHGFNMIIMGVGSFSFHASYTTLGHFMDIMGIPAVVGFVSCYSVATVFLEDLNRLSPAAKIGEAFSAVLCVVSFVAMQLFGIWFASTRAIDGLVLLSIEVGIIFACMIFKLFKEQFIFERAKYTVNYWFILVPLTFITIAVFCQELFIAAPWCHPTSWLQFHALWHLFCALALETLVLVLYTEQESNALVNSDWFPSDEAR